MFHVEACGHRDNVLIYLYVRAGGFARDCAERIGVNVEIDEKSRRLKTTRSSRQA